MSGLEELIIMDDVFSQFEDTLFSEASQNWERAIQTKEMNQKLDASIEEFLIHLSPKMLLRPAHKTLEWLIHR